MGTDPKKNNKHAAFASNDFIVSIIVDMLPILLGNTVYVIPENVRMDIGLLQKFIVDNKIISIYLRFQSLYIV